MVEFAQDVRPPTGADVVAEVECLPVPLGQEPPTLIGVAGGQAFCLHRGTGAESGSLKLASEETLTIFEALLARASHEVGAEKRRRNLPSRISRATVEYRHPGLPPSAARSSGLLAPPLAASGDGTGLRST